MTILSIVIGLLVIYGIFLMNGKGYSLIAGFNSKSDEELKKYDVVAVCKFFGKIIFALAVSIVFWILGEYYHLTWLIVFGVVLFLGIIIFYLVYIKNWSRFKK